jgi:transposase-like protein
LIERDKRSIPSCANADIAAAKRFFARAIEKRGVPEKTNLDGSAASRVVVVELQEEDILPASLTVRKGRYLNNVIE